MRGGRRQPTGSGGTRSHSHAVPPESNTWIMAHSELGTSMVHGTKKGTAQERTCRAGGEAMSDGYESGPGELSEGTAGEEVISHRRAAPSLRDKTLLQREHEVDAEALLTRACCCEGLLARRTLLVQPREGALQADAVDP